MKYLSNITRSPFKSLLTANGSSISAVHIRHSRVVRRSFCSLYLAALGIRTLHRVATPLNHERNITLVVMATMTYTLIHGTGAAISAEFSRVYPADKCDVIAYGRVVANWLGLRGRG